MLRFSLILTCFLMMGCSSAGPYVTNVSSNGDCGLVIEKGFVEYNYLLGTVSNKSNITTSTLKVCNE